MYRDADGAHELVEKLMHLGDGGEEGNHHEATPSEQELSEDEQLERAVAMIQYCVFEHRHGEKLRSLEFALLLKKRVFRTWAFYFLFLSLPQEILNKALMFNPQPLKAAMKAKRISVQELMAHMGWANHASWYRLFSENNPNWNTLERLCEYLDVPLSELSDKAPNTEMVRVSINNSQGGTIGSVSGGNAQAAGRDINQTAQNMGALETEVAALRRENELLRALNDELRRDKEFLQSIIQK